MRSTMCQSTILISICAIRMPICTRRWMIFPILFSGPIQPRRPAGRADVRRDISADDDFAAALDEWSDIDATNMPTRPSARPDRDLDREPRRFNRGRFRSRRR